MTNFTKEQLQQIAETDHVQCGDAAAMARQLLASMEQEPVIIVGDDGGDALAYRRLIQSFAPGTKLYAAPQLPQPAVAITQHFDTIALDTAKMVMCDVNRRQDFLGGDVQLLSRIQCRIDDACRAAVLQGAEPVSQPDELPMDYLQGHKDGLEWAARLAEANHPQTGDWLYDDPLELAKAIRKGPDMPTAAVYGWIPCSERMPEAMVSVLATGDWFDYAVTAWSGKEWLDFDDYEPPVTHWMPLPAAPQQEVKP